MGEIDQLLLKKEKEQRPRTWPWKAPISNTILSLIVLRFSFIGCDRQQRS